MKYKFFYFFIFFTGFFSSVASSDDLAKLRVFGFSEEGQYFSFEEFGIEDGSGFPYSHIFIYDTQNHTHVPDTPIYVRIDNDEIYLDRVRKKSCEIAQSFFEKYKIRQQYRHLVHVPFANSENYQDIPFLEDRFLNDFDPLLAYHLRLRKRTIFDEKCTFIGQDLKGIQLFVSQNDKEKEVLVDSLDRNNSQKCILDYQIADIFSYRKPESSDFSYVFILSYFPYGFEGAQKRRFLIASFDTSETLDK